MIVNLYDHARRSMEAPPSRPSTSGRARSSSMASRGEQGASKPSRTSSDGGIPGVPKLTRLREAQMGNGGFRPFSARNRLQTVPSQEDVGEAASPRTTRAKALRPTTAGPSLRPNRPSTAGRHRHMGDQQGEDARPRPNTAHRVMLRGQQQHQDATPSSDIENSMPGHVGDSRDMILTPSLSRPGTAVRRAPSPRTSVFAAPQQQHRASYEGGMPPSRLPSRGGGDHGHFQAGDGASTTPRPVWSATSPRQEQAGVDYPSYPGGGAGGKAQARTEALRRSVAAIEGLQKALDSSNHEKNVMLRALQACAGCVNAGSKTPLGRDAQAQYISNMLPGTDIAVLSLMGGSVLSAIEGSLRLKAAHGAPTGGNKTSRGGAAEDMIGRISQLEEALKQAGGASSTAAGGVGGGGGGGGGLGDETFRRGAGTQLVIEMMKAEMHSTRDELIACKAELLEAQEAVARERLEAEALRAMLGTAGGSAAVATPPLPPSAATAGFAPLPANTAAAAAQGGAQLHQQPVSSSAGPPHAMPTQGEPRSSSAVPPRVPQLRIGAVSSGGASASGPSSGTGVGAHAPSQRGGGGDAEGNASSSSVPTSGGSSRGSKPPLPGDAVKPKKEGDADIGNRVGGGKLRKGTPAVNAGAGQVSWESGGAHGSLAGGVSDTESEGSYIASDDSI